MEMNSSVTVEQNTSIRSPVVFHSARRVCGMGCEEPDVGQIAEGFVCPPGNLNLVLHK